MTDVLQFVDQRQFTIYQVDLNEISLGSFLLTAHRVDQLVWRISNHAFHLCKSLYRLQPKSFQLCLEFQLMLKVLDDTRSYKQPKIIDLGIFPGWKKNLRDWYRRNNKGCNLYVEMFYILTYEKSTV